MIAVTPVAHIRVELRHAQLVEFQRRLLDAEIYSIFRSGGSWPKHNPGRSKTLAREMWVTVGEYDPADAERVRAIHDEVVGA